MRPNLLLIVSDQHFADAMSGAGCAHVRTPALDNIAATGVRFTNTYCTYPVCTSSRASLMTGRWPHELKGAGQDAEDGAAQPKTKGEKGSKQGQPRGSGRMLMLGMGKSQSRQVLDRLHRNNYRSARFA